jgi:RNA polymerase sigma-70 factor (ECF subfamily)
MSDAAIDAETTQLAIRARGGDAEAFGRLVELHHRAARRVAQAALASHADADEAVQEACLVAWMHVGELADASAFRAWLLRITWRKAIDRRRSLAVWLRRLQPSSEDEDLGAQASDHHVLADVDLIARERDQTIARLIRSLPKRLRDPFLLAASGDHRYEDIASLLAVPLGTVKWRISEARRVLRAKLTRLGLGDER